MKINSFGFKWHKIIINFLFIKTKTDAKYFIKTRNFNSKKWVVKVLNISKKWGVTGVYEHDFDIKYYIETKSKIKAFFTFCFFMMLSKFSGGWTYIRGDGKKVDGNYKSIYL